MNFFQIEMSRSYSDEREDNYANFVFDGEVSVDDKLRKLHKSRFGIDYEQKFKSVAWTPDSDLISFQPVNEIKSSAHRAGWELIKIMILMTSDWQQQNH